MPNSRNLTRCYILLGIGCLSALLYYLVVTLPLLRQERAMDQRLAEISAELAATGYGLSAEEVEENIRTIEADIAAFAAIGRNRARTLHFAPQIRERINRPFQQFDFEENKLHIIENIREQAAQRKVQLFEGWEQNLPSFTPNLERPFLLWVQLGVTEQLLGAAIAAGVDSVDEFDLRVGERSEGLDVSQEVPVRMRLTGKMEAVHNILLALPLREEEMAALPLEWGAGPKSSFFLTRFILKKSSRENADEVSLDFVASGYLDAAPRL